jgi:hypothetical protein
MPPAGFKRSRAIWDETRREHSSRIELIRAWISAICYELQPIRLSDANKRQLVLGVKSSFLFLIYVIKSIPHLCKVLFVFLKSRSRRWWFILGGVVVYYYFIRWIHE